MYRILNFFFTVPYLKAEVRKRVFFGRFYAVYIFRSLRFLERVMLNSERSKGFLSKILSVGIHIREQNTLCNTWFFTKSTYLLAIHMKHEKSKKKTKEKKMIDTNADQSEENNANSFKACSFLFRIGVAKITFRIQFCSSKTTP